jgi:lipopolysaccharide export LptBFGC system permease protein LptF
MSLAGASPWRLLWPLLGVGLLSTAAALLLGELVSPPCERSADRRLGVTRASPLTGEGPPSGWVRQGRWFLQLTPPP